MPELTLNQLKKAVTGVANRTARRSERVRELARHIDEEAQDTTRVADGIGSLGVDTATVSETQDLARIMAGLSEAALTYASATDTTSRTARAAHDQAHASHGGIQEAVQRGTVDVSNLNREWLRQE